MFFKHTYFKLSIVKIYLYAFGTTYLSFNYLLPCLFNFNAVIRNPERSSFVVTTYYNELKFLKLKIKCLSREFPLFMF